MKTLHGLGLISNCIYIRIIRTTKKRLYHFLAVARRTRYIVAVLCDVMEDEKNA